ncbi:MAG: hypothetical protein QGG42_05655 [Phycisphaerae bacterium]|jgi:hypothetical protein|nr:hypothetical protein [Phycisphaerae bacterium]
MKYVISAMLLTVFLTVGCAQRRMTQFEYGDIRLEVRGRIKPGPTVAMTDFKPGVYYFLDRPPQQVEIEVKLLEVNRRDQNILGVSWCTGADPLIAAGSLINTTPRTSPAVMGGVINIGVGGGRSRGGCTHGPECTKCGSSPGGAGGGINFPVIAGREGDKNTNITSILATFNLNRLLDSMETTYLAIEIEVARAANGNIIVQPMLLPVRTVLGENPPTPPVKKPSTTVLLKEDQTIVIGGLVEDTEEEIKSKTPILNDIPYLGRLFKSNNTKIEKRNLIIFLTPHIIVPRE